MFIYGKNSVRERLRANPASIEKIFLQDGFDDQEILRSIKRASVRGGARRGGISVERLSSGRMVRMRRSKNLQGIMAHVEEFEYTPFDEILERPQNNRPALIFLDRIYDPQNLGAVIRTAACFGGFAIIIPRHAACEVNETVLHVASGGENYVPISRVSNLPTSIISAKKNGYWIMGGDVGEDAQPLGEACLSFPLGLVLGSEGKGIRYGVQKHIDKRVRIPMKAARLSFNVAIACSIFCYEISRLKNKTGQ